MVVVGGVGRAVNAWEIRQGVYITVNHGRRIWNQFLVLVPIMFDLVGTLFQIDNFLPIFKLSLKPFQFDLGK